MQHNSYVNIVALVSIGCHKVSGRECISDQDSKAIELGLKVAQQGLQIIHAGDSAHPVLRRYLGMGVNDMTVLQQDANADVTHTLYQHLETNRPDIILSGVRAEKGEGSGLLPFMLAEKLGWPVVSGITDIVTIDKNEAEVLQALPRGQRRSIKVTLPFIATVDSAAQSPRQSAYGPSQRSTIISEEKNTELDQEKIHWVENPAKKRTKRMKISTAKTAADRFKAATAKTQSSGGVVMKNQSVEEKAQAIYTLLKAEGVIK